ncbi:hypothetical protein LTR10_005078 [Elasticomyces elasticus]|nr:hypothetical protein LTR10_005078 [Elasticomyces elasticus]KAK4975819.1 hypothetical protein LTR42_003440 [Elasticomyces elasticus]
MAGKNTESEEGGSCSALQQLLHAFDRILTDQSAIEALASCRVAGSTDEPHFCGIDVLEMAVLMDLKALAEVRDQFEIQEHRKIPIDDLPKQCGEAAKTFFDTPELLELALLHLPVPDLLRTQGTCHGFQDIVAGSPSGTKMVIDWFWQRHKVDKVERTKLDDSLDVYVRAKHYAHMRGDPIPTLEQYKRLAIDDPEAYWKARTKPVIDPRDPE